MDPQRITPRLLDALHTEVLLLADEARFYFDGAGRGVRETLDPMARVDFACESLKLTARLVQVMTWLMDHRAAARSTVAVTSSARIGVSAPSEPQSIMNLPREARQLVEAGIELHARIDRLDRVLAGEVPVANTIRSLISRLESVF